MKLISTLVHHTLLSMLQFIFAVEAVAAAASFVPPFRLTVATPLVSRKVALPSRNLSPVVMVLLLLLHRVAVAVGGAAVADAERSGDRVGLEGDAHARVERADAAAPRHLLGRGVRQVE